MFASANQMTVQNKLKMLEDSADKSPHNVEATVEQVGTKRNFESLLL